MTKNTALKGCVGGCAGLGGLIVLVFVVMHFVLGSLTPEQKAALHSRANAGYEARKAAEDAPVDQFLNRFRDLRARLASAAEMKERLYPAFTEENLNYLAVDNAFLQQFTPQGFKQEPSQPLPAWYRGQVIKNLQGALVNNEAQSKRDNHILLDEQKEVEHAPYLVVIVPVEQRWPALNTDGKTFETGVFRGWVILLDGKTWEPLGQSSFTSQNSDKVTSLRVGLGRELVGAGLKQVLEEDFTDRFWQAANEALAHLCKKDGNRSFASQSNHFSVGN